MYDHVSYRRVSTHKVPSTIATDNLYWYKGWLHSSTQDSTPQLECILQIINGLRGKSKVYTGWEVTESCEGLSSLAIYIT